MKKILCIVLSIMMLLMASCASKNNENKNDDTTATEETQKAKDTTTETEEILGFYKTDEEVYEIETPYCALKYSAKWADYTLTEVNDENGVCTVTFKANLEGVELGLFSFVIADEYGDAYELGTLETSSGEKKVFFVDQYDESNADLSLEAQIQYIEMTEDMNVVISKLIYDNGMVLA